MNLLATSKRNEYVWVRVPDEVQGDTIAIEYHTLSGNKPKSNNNYVGIWESDGNVPVGTDVVYKFPIDKDVPSASTFLVNTGISVGPHVLGYSQVGDPSGEAPVISATATIPTSSNNACVQQSITIDLSFAGVSALFTYKGITNMEPVRCGHWFGIWKTSDPTDLLHAQAITGSGWNGSVSVQFTFARDNTYSIGYYIGGFNTDLSKCDRKHIASLLTFDVTTG